MARQIQILLFFLACGLLSACKENVVLEDFDRSRTLSCVRVVYTPGGLGDRGLSDDIYTGILSRDRFKNEEIDFALENYCFETFEYSEFAISNWFESKDAGPQFKNRLLILADNRYVDVLLAHPEWKIPEGDAVLVLDSPKPLPAPWQNVYTRAVSSYASAYMGAHVMNFIAKGHPAIVCSNPEDIMQKEICNGFIDGLRDAGIEFDKAEDIYYLGKTIYDGYTDAESLNHLCYRLDEEKHYDFVLPACGSSIQGLLRYTRDHPQTFLTCGVNVDQQDYSDKVAFSTIKGMKEFVDDFLGAWLAGEALGTNIVYGFESVYSDIIIADSYEKEFSIHKDLFPLVIGKTIKAEKEYLKQ